MKVIQVQKNKNNRYAIFFDWFFHMLSYTLILLLASNIFRAIYIKNFFYGFLAAVIIFILNKTIKPILINVSLPLIGLSLGLFYFFINVLILYITDIILFDGFNVDGIFSPYIISIFISFINLLIEYLIFKPIKEKKGRM
ncbi:MAG TPA: phage holin family protein [Bacilli bacterium]|nr:phage holin family protein [Bacilli bacterium]